MDYATKGIVMILISITVYCLLFQFEVLESIFGGITDIIGSIVDPIKNLIGNFT